MATIFDQVAAAEARYRSESTTDAERVAHYQRDLAALFEALSMYTTLVNQQKAQIAALTSEIDRLRNRTPASEDTAEDLQAQVRRAMAELIRRGMNPTDAIAAGIPDRKDFKPRIVK